MAQACWFRSPMSSWCLDAGPWGSSCRCPGTMVSGPSSRRPIQSSSNSARRSSRRSSPRKARSSWAGGRSRLTDLHSAPAPGPSSRSCGTRFSAAIRRSATPIASSASSTSSASDSNRKSASRDSTITSTSIFPASRAALSSTRGCSRPPSSGSTSPTISKTRSSQVRSAWSTRDSAPTRSRAGSSPILTGWSRIMARSTRCEAISTG